MLDGGGLTRTYSLLVKSTPLAGEMATKPEDRLREWEGQQKGWGCPQERDVSQSTSFELPRWKKHVVSGNRSRKALLKSWHCLLVMEIFKWVGHSPAGKLTWTLAAGCRT